MHVKIQDNSLNDTIFWALTKAARFAIISAFVALATFTVMGTAGLAFFFVFKFAEIFAIPALITWVGAGIVSTIIFSAYFSIFTIGIYNISLTICDNALPLEPKFNEEADIENNIKAKSNVEKTNFLQRIAQITVGLFGITASIFLGGGAYLGVYTVGEALGMLGLFAPLAVMSAISMFTAMTLFLWADMMNNAKAMAAPYNPIAKKTTAEKHQFSSDAKWVLWKYRIMAIGASIGFGTFKLYSTIHVVKLLGITSPLAISVLGGIAFVSLVVQTGFTSGVRIWQKGTEYALQVDGVECESTTAPADTKEKINPWRYRYAKSITFLAAVFNGVASYMGMNTLSAFFCSFFPAYAIVIAPAFVVLGSFVAITRFVDFWEYYGPFIAENLGGVEYIKRQDIPEREDEISSNKTNTPSPAVIVSSADLVARQFNLQSDYEHFSDPLGTKRKNRGASSNGNGNEGKHESDFSLGTLSSIRKNN